MNSVVDRKKSNNLSFRWPRVTRPVHFYQPGRQFSSQAASDVLSAFSSALVRRSRFDNNPQSVLAALQPTLGRVGSIIIEPLSSSINSDLINRTGNIISRCPGSSHIQKVIQLTSGIVADIVHNVANGIHVTFRYAIPENPSSIGMSEIVKRDATFTFSGFFLQVRNEIIPGVLKSYSAGDIDGLKEYCDEKAHQFFFSSLMERKTTGTSTSLHVISVADFELISVYSTSQGPIVCIAFDITADRCTHSGQGNEGVKSVVSQRIQAKLILRPKGEEYKWRLHEVMIPNAEEFL